MRKWSAKVSEHCNAMTLADNVFKRMTPAIARPLKMSVERSHRRKGTPFQSALSMLNFYINRAGKNLRPDTRKKLEGAKSELRKIFHRTDRKSANRRRANDHRHGTLDLAAFNGFQLNWYRAEKIIFAFMLVFILAAMAGYMGDDQKGTQTIQTFENVSLSYAKIGRYSAQSKITADVSKDYDKDELTISFDRAFLRKADIIKVTPTPVSMSSDSHGLIYHFNGRANAGGHIDFEIKNQSMGIRASAVGVNADYYPIARIILP